MCAWLRTTASSCRGSNGKQQLRRMDSWGGPGKRPHSSNSRLPLTSSRYIEPVVVRAAPRKWICITSRCEFATKSRAGIGIVGNSEKSNDKLHHNSNRLGIVIRVRFILPAPLLYAYRKHARAGGFPGLSGAGFAEFFGFQQKRSILPAWHGLAAATALFLLHAKDVYASAGNVTCLHRSSIKILCKGKY